MPLSRDRRPLFHAANCHPDDFVQRAFSCAVCLLAYCRRCCRSRAYEPPDHALLLPVPSESQTVREARRGFSLSSLVPRHDRHRGLRRKLYPGSLPSGTRDQRHPPVSHRSECGGQGTSAVSLLCNSLSRAPHDKDQLPKDFCRRHRYSVRLQRESLLVRAPARAHLHQCAHVPALCLNVAQPPKENGPNRTPDRRRELKVLISLCLSDWLAADRASLDRVPIELIH